MSAITAPDPFTGGVALLLVALALGPFHSPASAQGIAKLSDTDRFDISRIEKYLNRIKTLEARFLQVSSDGDYSEGDLYFSKPGKMRLNYDSPSPITIVSDGVNLGYYDKELEQISYINLEWTQASILLRENISFTAGDILVTAFERGPGVFIREDFCLICVPFGHYDEPEILPYENPSVCPKGADVRHKTQGYVRVPKP